MVAFRAVENQLFLALPWSSLLFLALLLLFFGVSGPNVYDSWLFRGEGPFGHRKSALGSASRLFLCPSGSSSPELQERMASGALLAVQGFFRKHCGKVFTAAAFSDEVGKAKKKTAFAATRRSSLEDGGPHHINPIDGGPKTVWEFIKARCVWGDDKQAHKLRGTARWLAEQKNDRRTRRRRRNSAGSRDPRVFSTTRPAHARRGRRRSVTKTSCSRRGARPPSSCRLERLAERQNGRRARWRRRNSAGTRDPRVFRRRDRRTHDEVGGARSQRRRDRGAALARRRRVG